MDKQQADIERSLRREDYPRFDHDPRELEALRRRGPRGGGTAGSEPSPVEPKGGGGLSGGAAAAVDKDKSR